MDRGKKVDRHATPEEVIFIFDKVLEDWKTIKIYNVMKQTMKETKVTKKDVENIATGNVKVNSYEVCKEKFQEYEEKRSKVYEKIQSEKKLKEEKKE